MCEFYYTFYSIIFLFYLCTPAKLRTGRGLILNSISTRFRSKPGDILRDFNHIAVIFNSFYYYCYCPLVAGTGAQCAQYAQFAQCAQCAQC